jgi:hypothetical protein
MVWQSLSCRRSNLNGGNDSDRDDAPRKAKAKAKSKKSPTRTTLDNSEPSDKIDASMNERLSTSLPSNSSMDALSNKLDVS